MTWCFNHGDSNRNDITVSDDDDNQDSDGEGFKQMLKFDEHQAVGVPKVLVLFIFLISSVILFHCPTSCDMTDNVTLNASKNRFRNMTIRFDLQSTLKILTMVRNERVSENSYAANQRANSRDYKS